LCICMGLRCEGQAPRLSDALYFSGTFSKFNASSSIQNSFSLKGIGEVANGTVSDLGLGLDLPTEGLSMAPHPSGVGVYVAGAFSLANGEEVARVSLMMNGSMLPVDLGTSNTVLTTQVHEPSGLLYIGGLFSEATGVGVGYVTSWDGNEWDPMGGGVSMGFDCVASEAGTTSQRQPSVHALQLMGGDAFANYLDSPTKPKVFVGGHFTTAGVGADAVAANNVAMWDPQSGKWESLCDPLPPNRCNIQGVSGDERRQDVQYPIVFALALHEPSNRLFVGGVFASAGQKHNYVDALSSFNIVSKAWTIVSGGIAGRNPIVYSLIIKADVLYVGGSFQHVGKSNRDTVAAGIRSHSVAILDASTDAWSGTTDALGDGTVYSVAVGPSGILYAGGDFSEVTVGGEAVTMPGLVYYSVADGWQSVFDAGAELNGAIHAVHAQEFAVETVLATRLVGAFASSKPPPSLLLATLLSASALLAALAITR